jgi:class 3 adenylate cyclase
LRSFDYRWVWPLRSSPQALWPFVADTNRFNRDTGIPALAGGEVGASGRRTLRFSKLGVPIEWEEEPFEWIEPRRFSVLRRYTRGPLAEMLVEVELAPDDAGGTRATYEVRARSKNLLGLLATPVEIGWLSRRRFERTFRRYDLQASAAAAPREGTPKPKLVPAGKARLDSAGAVLRREGFPEQLVERLLRTIEEADDLDVVRLGPYVLADEWQADRRTVLELCLHATRAGVLELRWDLLCPLCRGPRERDRTLAELNPTVHCDSCGIDFAANFEQSVELSFRPAPTVRDAEAPEFCVGGPQLTPHVLAQQLLAPGEARAVELELPRGLYRLRTRDGASEHSVVVSEDGPDHAAAPLGGGRDAAEPLRIGERAALRLTNATGDELLAVLERPGRGDQAVTAAEVTALQTFRDLFASEALRPGEPIAVGTQTLLFTDLRDSTRFYREIGDAPAFGSVAEHLAVLRGVVAAENGAVVKTMGDAIMAIFPRPVLAVRAALRAHREAAAPPNGRRPFVLKAGIHTGPCIAVTQNGRLDYFGTTVNVAARLVGLSAGGDLVVSDAVRADPEVDGLLTADEAAEVEPVEAALKGLEDERLALWRVRVPTQAAADAAPIRA